MSIFIHDGTGKNKHNCFCPRCGSLTGKIVHFGPKEAVTTCPNCGTINYAAKPNNTCGKCFRLMAGGSVRILKKKEKIPDQNVCSSCAQDIRDEQIIVRNGGLFFRCQECGKTGIILPESGLKIREEIGKGYNIKDEGGFYPACGVDFKRCAQHEK